MRATAHLLTLLVCGVMATSALAQELSISGRVVDEHGGPAAGVELRLLPILSPFDQALLEFSGSALPAAATSARTDDRGNYRLRAPEPGFWRLVAKKAGHAAMECAFRREPLFEATTLPELDLLPARTIRVDVESPTGAPAAGGWIESWVTGTTPQRTLGHSWRPHLPPARWQAGTAVELVVPKGDDVEVQAWQRGYRASPKTVVTGRSGRLRLEDGTARRLLITDSAGNPLSGVILRVGGVGWPAARTGADGRAMIHGGADGVQASILLADGRRARIHLGGRQGLDEEPFEFRVADARSLRGRVIDVETRQPVADAFVYPAIAVGRFVRTDARGGFLLDGLAQKEVWLSAAAPGFLQNGAGADPTTTSITITLQATVDLPGRVLDAAGDPLEGAELFARPHSDSLQYTRAVLRSPSRLSISDGLGEFVAPRLNKDLAYSISARLDGFAPTEAIVRDLEEAASTGGVILTLESGTALSGRIVAPDGRGVAGAHLTLERAAASEIMRYLRGNSRQSRPFRFEFSADAQGEFSFADTPIGEFNLQVEARGFALELLPVFEIELGIRSHDLGIITLEPGVQLAGRVVDVDGLVLDGAKVSLSKREGVMFSASFGPELEVLSDADGSFFFEDRRRGEFLDLQVKLAGYAEKEVPRVEVPPESLLEIALEPAVTVQGRVVTPDGQPISGASVTVAREGGGSSYGGQVFNSPDAWGRSDDLGRFEVADIKPGTVRVSARANGWLATEIGDLELAAGREPDELEIELRPGATVSGRVIGPAGAPLSEATVGVQDSRNMRSSNTTSDGDGNYSLSGVEPGKRMIGAHHEGLRAVKELEVETGDNDLDFYFEAGVEISGSVVSPAGDPVEGATVSLSGSGERSYGGEATSARSDSAGGFRIENVQPGLLDLTAEHPDFGTTTLEEPLEVGTAPISGLQIRLVAGVELTGSVLGAAPEDLVTLELMAFRQQGGLLKQGRIDSKGGYRIANLSPGAWLIWVQSATGRQISEHLEIAEGETQVVLDLEFKDGLVLSGRVLKRGEPLGGAWVFASGTDTESGASAQTDHQGRFKLTGLHAGTHTLGVTGLMGGVSHREEIDLQRDEDVLIELDGTGVAGRVTHRSGHAPLSGVSIVLEAVVEGNEGGSSQPTRGTRSDAAGRFRLSDVSPGRYRIRAAKPGFAAESTILHVTDDEIDDVDFALEEVQGLSMTVLQFSGAPVTRVSYAVLDLAGTPIHSGNATATSEGLIRLATVPDGDWTVILKGTGAAIEILRTQAPRENLPVQLKRAATLAVRVEDLLHDTSTVATLRLTDADGSAFKSLDWNGEAVVHWRLRAGRIMLDDLPAGRWILSISTTDGRAWDRSVNLDAGTNDEIVFN